ncbi:MAG TPA: von Willebrand factor type A domain-containing protein [Thermoanaerobaculia bacterium]|nr:von Willebrand factor type A domain-containing protein [Thermoanaerobaculia bacterium]
MNSKRRADLQRKLSMGAVPKPPAGLAERIKADIPKYLEAVPESTARATFSWSTTFRVAASLMLLMVTALITMRVMEPAREGAPSLAQNEVRKEEKMVPAVLQYRTRPAADGVATTSTRPEAQVELTIEQPLPVPRTAAPQRAREADDEGLSYELAQGERRQDAREEAVAGNLSGRIAPEPATPPAQLADAAAEAPAQSFVAEAAPAPAAAAPPPPASVPAQAATMARTAENAAARKSATGFAPQIVAEAHAGSLDLETPTSVFGISVDPAVFQSIKSAIESGRRPPAQNVNVDAVVNYFAGPPVRAPRRVGLEVEASPAPVDAGRELAILRFTVDTPRVNVPAGGSALPAAKDARVTIDVNHQTVESIHRVGGSPAMTPESALLHNTSVTGLYELQLKPRLRPSQRVATVRLHYRSVETGREYTLEKIVHVHDLVKTWSKASRRHRLASLGALWTQTLTGTSGGPEVAKRAQELATQDPEDTRARDLAKAASATTGGGR